MEIAREEYYESLNRQRELAKNELFVRLINEVDNIEDEEVLIKNIDEYSEKFEHICDLISRAKYAGFKDGIKIGIQSRMIKEKIFTRTSIITICLLIAVYCISYTWSHWRNHLEYPNKGPNDFITREVCSKGSRQRAGYDDYDYECLEYKNVSEQLKTYLSREANNFARTITFFAFFPLSFIIYIHVKSDVESKISDADLKAYI